jgi:amino acid transporter
MPGLIRRLLIGHPLPTHRARHERLPKTLALPVFASDALSSTAYATQEILSTLLLAGVGLAAFQYATPIAWCIVALLAIVTVSYQQTIHAYPSGGGAYIVARENLGILPSLTAGAALLIDYVLTVAVSVAAGIDAIISAAAQSPHLFEQLNHVRVPLCVVAVAIITIANLRGVKESGAIFALPSYSFIVITLAMIAWGAMKMLNGQLHPVEAPQALAVSRAAGTFLLLKAFSSGCAALTGVEAISNGVTAFQAPEARNAGITMIWMSSILGTMFLGLTYLARHLHTLYQVGGETVISQVGRAVFGTGPLYFFLQAATAAILILAANTSFADFPRLSALQAADGYLPRQFRNVGDRLVFSNGIIALGIISSLIIALFGGHTDYLIPLYAVGVFLSFTLSQAGMVRHWFQLKTPRWQGNALINGTGAVVTGLVTLIIAYSKWTAGEKLHVGPVAIPTGAWMVVVMVPALVYMFFLIHHHYAGVARQLTLEHFEEPAPRVNTVLLLVPGVHRGIIPAMQFARSLSSNVRAVYVEMDAQKTPAVQEKWAHWGHGMPLVVLECPYRGLVEPLTDYIDQVELEREDDHIVVVLPEFVPATWWEQLLHNQTGLMVKLALLKKENVIVCNVRYFLGRHEALAPIRPGGPTPEASNGWEAERPASTLPPYEVVQHVQEESQ